MAKVRKKKSVNFTDTEVAFKHKNNSELHRSYLLFKVLENPILAKLGPRVAGVSMKFKLPVRRIIKSTMFGQFCGGENIDECKKTIASLGCFDVGTILDFATEACDTDDDFDRVLNEVKRTIELAKKETKVPFAVFKPTGLGRLGLMEKRDRKLPLSAEEKDEFNLIKSRFASICKYAHDR